MLEKVEWKTLGEVITLEKGKQLNKEFLFEKWLYPAYNWWVSYSWFTNTYNYSENTIIVSQWWASAGFVNFVKTKFYANAHCYVVLPNTNMVQNKFIYYLLKEKQKKLMGKQHGAWIPALNTTEILNIKIPIPSLATQQKIVTLLDKFDALVNDLTTGLPAELESRKKQYEHYRNQLLTF